MKITKRKLRRILKEAINQQAVFSFNRSLSRLKNDLDDLILEHLYGVYDDPEVNQAINQLERSMQTLKEVLAKKAGIVK